MTKIVDIKARQVFDSRGYPTVEADVLLESKALGRFITPAGASVGKKEAIELRDNDMSRFAGRGVLKAIANIHGEISRAVKNRSLIEQRDLDHILIELDGTPNKSRLGANAILCVSGAFFHALANERQIALYRSIKDSSPFRLPRPLVNIINGGVHANNKLDIQEFMITPNTNNFSEGMRMVAETFYALKSILQAAGFSTSVGDEGGFAPALASNEQALDLLATAVNKAGLQLYKDINFALDVAASELFDENQEKYRLNGHNYGRQELLDWYERICQQYPIVSIEDPFHEEDIEGFSAITKHLGGRIQIVGDDLFVTNEKYIRPGIDNHYANAVLIKMNQIGTITETIAATKLTMNAGFNAIISHRSGDSEDTTIADLAVLTRCGQIKTGSVSRSERTAKYNRLLRIEEELHGQ